MLAKTIDPEFTIRKEGYESKSVGDDGQTIFYVLGKTKSPERIALLENNVTALPKDPAVLQVCELMRGGAKSKLIEQTGQAYDIAVSNYGYDGSTIVCVLKFMLNDSVGTQISYTKQGRDGVYQLFIKS